jgi:putative endonuclease
MLNLDLGVEKMTIDRQLIGKTGEKAAKEYLEKQGYQIVETNYRCPLGELDIIARDVRTTVLIEVRTKTGSSFGSPEESITADKAKRLKRLAAKYLQTHGLSETPSRIDLVAVQLARKDLSILGLKQIKGILSG